MLFVRITSQSFVTLFILCGMVALVSFAVYLLIPDSTTKFSLKHNSVASIVVGIMCLLLALFEMVFLCCYQNRIALSSNIVTVADRFLNNNKKLLLLCLILIAVFALFFVWWVFLGLCYFSMGDIDNSTRLPFEHYKMPNIVKAWSVVYIFSLLWSLTFLIDTGRFIIGGTAVSWYL